MTLQEKLNSNYEPLVNLKRVLERLGPCDAPEAVLRQLNGPFLLCATEQYQASRPKVVIVGQENNGWLECDYWTFLNEQDVNDALAVYEGFDIAEYGSGFFGRHFSEFRNRIRGTITDDNRRSVLYNNLFKLNHDGKHSIDSPHLEVMLRIQQDVFAKEIEALAPDVVIFLTGPDYDFVLERFYPGIVFEQVDSHPINEIAQLKSGRLPDGTYRTYHPGHLHFVQSKKPHCVEAILKRVTGRSWR